MGQSTSFSSTLLFTMTGIYPPKSQAQELSKFNSKHLVFAMIIFLPFCMWTYFCQHHWFIIQHNFRSSKFMPPLHPPLTWCFPQRKERNHWFVWLLPSFSPESAPSSPQSQHHCQPQSQHHCQPQNLRHSQHHPHLILRVNIILTSSSSERSHWFVWSLQQRPKSQTRWMFGNNDAGEDDDNDDDWWLFMVKNCAYYDMTWNLCLGEFLIAVMLVNCWPEKREI